MGKQRMLYIMGIDWEWIYQRPQIFAEKLAQDYEVTVVFPRSILSGNRKLPQIPQMKFKIIWTIPLQEKNFLIRWISNIINKLKFRDLNDYSYVYVGYPLYARYISDDYSGKIIYDCMDNHEALYPDTKRVDKVLEQEILLIKNSHVLLVSAERLQKKLDNIAGKQKSILMRNGVKLNTITQIKQPQIKDKYSLCYIGTISKWFDYEVVVSSLNELPNIAYELIGPGGQKVEHPRIHYQGPKEHNMLGSLVADYDCLVMPFIVDEIVEYVDPVKLYEYIAFGKCIISVYYPEIARFGEFVYFYKDGKDYVQLLKQLEREGFPPKYNQEQQLCFLNENTWDKRYEQLVNEIKKTEM